MYFTNTIVQIEIKIFINIYRNISLCMYIKYDNN